MPALDRDDVAHLARLSRLQLTDSELDHYGEQLDVILGAVARVAEVAADDVPPTTHAVPGGQCRATGRHRPRVCPAMTSWRAHRPPRTTASGCPASWTRRSSERPDAARRRRDWLP